MRRWWMGVLVVVFAGVGGMGCDRAPMLSESRPGVTLNMHEINKTAEGCAGILSEVELAVCGTVRGRRTVESGQAEAAFDGIEVTEGDTLQVLLRSPNGRVLYEADRAVTATALDAGEIRLTPAAVSPVLEVCPDSLVVNFVDALPEFTVHNVGVGTLPWDLVRPFATCGEGEDLGPCFANYDLGEDTLRTDEATWLLLVSNRRAEGETFPVGVEARYADATTDVATPSLRLNACMDFDDQPDTTYDDAYEGRQIIGENGAEGFLERFLSSSGSFILGRLSIENSQQFDFGRRQIIFTDSATLRFVFPEPIPYIRFDYLDVEGSINFSVNEDPVTPADDLSDTFPVPDGIEIRIETLQDRRRLTLLGHDGTTISQLRIGGQGLLLDNVCFGEPPTE